MIWKPIKLVGFAHDSQITPSVVAYAGQRESSLFGLVDGIPPSIAHIFFPNPAGLHSSNKLRPARALGGRMSAHSDSLTTEGKCTTAVGSLELCWDYKGAHSAPTFHEVWQPKRASGEDTCSACFVFDYLDLGGCRAFGLFLWAFRVFSRFLDEGKWFIHDRCVVHMAGQRAGGAGCWTPHSGRCGALRPVKRRRRWRRSLGSFANAPAQRPLSPEMIIH